MSVIGAFVVPHTPHCIPAIGQKLEQNINKNTDNTKNKENSNKETKTKKTKNTKNKLKPIKKTIEAYQTVADEIARLAPETIVVITPHSTIYSNYIHISPGTDALGDFDRFGAPDICISAKYDSELVSEIIKYADETRVAAGTKGEQDPRLDYGTMVPLHFINEKYTNYKVVRISTARMTATEHYYFGTCIQRAADSLGRRVVVIASGDLSHKVSEKSPYGYHLEGPKFDKKITDMLSTGKFGEVFKLDYAKCDKAAECALAAIQIMMGTLDKIKLSPKMLSYEAPNGIGYAVVSFDILGTNPRRNFGEVALDREIAELKATCENEDAYARLARIVVETYVCTGKIANVPPEIAENIDKKPAGVFVSIHRNGRLRGCVGTYVPTTDSLDIEIIINAISCCSKDPRFKPIEKHELHRLTYTVDVLGPLEKMPNKTRLNSHKYGVLVDQNGKRGLVLPKMDGVTSVKEQLEIACRKAGIDPDSQFDLYRFDVTRHV